MAREPATVGTGPRGIRAVRKRWRNVFLVDFAKNANVTGACAKAGVHRSRFYRARDRSPAFARAFAEALKTAGDRIRAEVTRRGLEGWDEPVFGKIGIVGHRRVYDGGLLAKLAQAHCEEFKPASKVPKVTVNATTNLTVMVSEAQLAELQARRKAATEGLVHGRN